MVDADMSGFIDSHEVSYVLKLQLGRNPTDEEVAAMITAFDKDEDGMIDFEEYMEWLLGEGWSVEQSSAEKAGFEQSSAIDAWVFRYGALPNNNKASLTECRE